MVNTALLLGRGKIPISKGIHTPETNWLSPSAFAVPPIKDGFLKMSKEFIHFWLVAVPLLRRLKGQDNIELTFAGMAVAEVTTEYQNTDLSNESALAAEGPNYSPQPLQNCCVIGKELFPMQRSLLSWPACQRQHTVWRIEHLPAAALLPRCLDLA